VSSSRSTAHLSSINSCTGPPFQRVVRAVVPSPFVVAIFGRGVYDVESFSSWSTFMFRCFRSPSARRTRCDEHAADEVSNPIGMKSRRRLSGAAGAVSFAPVPGTAQTVSMFFRVTCFPDTLPRHGGGKRDDGSVFFFLRSSEAICGLSRLSRVRCGAPRSLRW